MRVTPSTCPCCGFRTLLHRGDYEICPVCFWEDDGQGDGEADEVWSGPNHGLSLTQARANFARFGACEERFVPHVRPPYPEEFPVVDPPSLRDRPRLS